ncbi:MAG: methyltransferase family protein [Gemmatimonadota bacterium]
MSLRDELIEQGEWLFRWRSYLPLLALLIVFLALQDLSHRLWNPLTDRSWETVCFLVAVVGLLVRAYTVGTTPPGTSGRTTRKQVAESLNTTGMYSMVRHPLYLGNYLMWLGIALYPRSWEVLLLVSLIFWVYYERIMMAEEAFLEQRFGAEWKEWAARTPAFLPNPTLWRPSRHPFSLRKALGQEFTGCFAVLVILASLEVTAMQILHDRWALDPAWAGLLMVSTVLYLALRTLKRHTNLLDARPG